MNKQELIEKYEKLEGVCKDPGAEIARLIFLEDLKELDETQEVEIPIFVADWIEVCKEYLTSSLYLAMTPSFLKANNQGIELTIWIKKNEETFARAWLDGYEVEKEKRYTVKMRATKQPLFYNNMYEKTFFSLGDLATRFTRKQLKGLGLGWVFDCPGIEIEEVE